MPLGMPGRRHLLPISIWIREILHPSLGQVLAVGLLLRGYCQAGLLAPQEQQPDSAPGSRPLWWVSTSVSLSTLCLVTDAGVLMWRD